MTDQFDRGNDDFLLVSNNELASLLKKKGVPLE